MELHFVQRSLNLATNYFVQEHVGTTIFRAVYGEGSDDKKLTDLI